MLKQANRCFNMALTSLSGKNLIILKLLLIGARGEKMTQQNHFVTRIDLLHPEKNLNIQGLWRG